MRKTISAVYHNCFRFLNKKNGVSPQGGAPLTTSFSVKQRPDCLHLSVLSDTFIRHSLIEGLPFCAQKGKTGSFYTNSIFMVSLRRVVDCWHALIAFFLGKPDPWVCLSSGINSNTDNNNIDFYGDTEVCIDSSHASVSFMFGNLSKRDCLSSDNNSNTYNNIEFFGGTEACFDRLYASVSFWAVPQWVGLPFCANNIMYI